MNHQLMKVPSAQYDAICENTPVDAIQGVVINEDNPYVLILNRGGSVLDYLDHDQQMWLPLGCDAAPSTLSIPEPSGVRDQSAAAGGGYRDTSYPGPRPPELVGFGEGSGSQATPLQGQVNPDVPNMINNLKPGETAVLWKNQEQLPQVIYRTAEGNLVTPKKWQPFNKDDGSTAPILLQVKGPFDLEPNQTALVQVDPREPRQWLMGTDDNRLLTPGPTGWIEFKWPTEHVAP